MSGEAMPTGRERPGEHWNARLIREEVEEAARLKQIAPPPTDVMFMLLGFQDGKAYAAPLGTSFDNTDAWMRVESLESLAAFLNVPYASKGVEW